jgi:hypothetical protein
MGSPQEFWEFLKKTRGTDPVTGGEESLRRWAARLNVDINNLISWSRGGRVSPRLIKQVVEALGLPDHEFYRLVELSQPEAPPLEASEPIPIFRFKTFTVEDGRVMGERVGNAKFPSDLISDDNCIGVKRGNGKGFVLYLIKPGTDDITDGDKVLISGYPHTVNRLTSFPPANLSKHEKIAGRVLIAIHGYRGAEWPS